MQIKIYQYYNEDINDKSYHYTVDYNILVNNNSKGYSGRSYSFDTDAAKVIKNKYGEVVLLAVPRGQLLFPYVINGNMYLIYEESVDYGYEITQSIYKCLGKLDEHLDNAVSDECKAVIEQAEQFIRTVQTTELERKRSEAEKKAEIMSHIDSWTTEEKAIRDEGGKTTEYIHHITVGNSEMTFTERNIFDFGRAVNYKNGLVLSKNGVYLIKTPNGEQQLSQAETEAAIAVFKYGKYARSGIRM